MLFANSLNDTSGAKMKTKLLITTLAVCFSGLAVGSESQDKDLTKAISASLRIVQNYSSACEFDQNVDQANEANPYIEELLQDAQVFHENVANDSESVVSSLDGKSESEILKTFKAEVLPKCIALLQVIREQAAKEQK